MTCLGGKKKLNQLPGRFLLTLTSSLEVYRSVFVSIKRPEKQINIMMLLCCPNVDSNFWQIALSAIILSVSYFPPENVITEFCSVSLRETLGVNLHEGFCVEFPLGAVRHEAFIPLWEQRNTLNDVFRGEVFIFTCFPNFPPARFSTFPKFP